MEICNFHKEFAMSKPCDYISIITRAIVIFRSACFFFFAQDLSSHAATLNIDQSLQVVQEHDYLIKAYLIGSSSVTSVSHLIRLPIFDHDGSHKCNCMLSLSTRSKKNGCSFLCVLDPIPNKMAVYTLPTRT